MEIVFEILKYTLPSLILCVVVYLLLAKFLQAEENRRRYRVLQESQKTTLPIRLTAYERMVLFMERISPDSLLVRMQDDSLTALQLHASLLTAIRAEYEHNVAQQIYMSQDAWSVVKSAKEHIVQLINACATQVEPQEPSHKLAEVILATYEHATDSPTIAAVAFLKEEIKAYFA